MYCSKPTLGRCMRIFGDVRMCGNNILVDPIQAPPPVDHALRHLFLISLSLATFFAFFQLHPSPHPALLLDLRLSDSRDFWAVGSFRVLLIFWLIFVEEVFEGETEEERFAKMPGLSLGDVIPNIEADSTQGHIKLHDYCKDGWTIIFSHPGTGDQKRLLFLRWKRNTRVVWVVS